MALRKSDSALAEERLQAAEIAQAISFAAHIRVGPHEKHTTRDLATPEAAFAEADRLTEAHGRYGRRAMVFAISAKGRETLCTPDLVALARSL
jgi:hypothetical protein